jgi:flagellar basal-body rod protein FlgF
METTGYAALSRQSGLLREMQIVANNLANSATTGFRQEGLVFSEFIRRTGHVGGSLSMTQANTRNTSLQQGMLTQTGGTFDLAIEGDGFFQVETPGGNRLTRSGTFAPDANGDLVTPDGFRVLDSGGAPIFIPPNFKSVNVAADGTISSDGQLVGQVGVFEPTEKHDLLREDGVLFHVTGDIEEVDNPQILQRFLENSNVNSISQLSRMIEIQRAYELGQSFLVAEDKRIREAVKTLIR